MNKFYGEWKINKKKSDSIDELLKFFGVPYIARKLVGSDNTVVIKEVGKGEISIKDITKGGEQEDLHKFEDKFIKSVDGRGTPVKKKSVFKEGIITVMTLSNNSIMIIRQFDVRGNTLRDRIYYKKFGDNEFKSVTRFYNRDKSRNAKSGGGKSKRKKQKKR